MPGGLSITGRYEQATRYGVAVWEDTEMDHLRQERHLCDHCSRQGLCRIAEETLALAQQCRTALMMTRCPHFDYASPQGAPR